MGYITNADPAENMNGVVVTRNSAKLYLLSIEGKSGSSADTLRVQMSGVDSSISLTILTVPKDPNNPAAGTHNVVRIGSERSLEGIVDKKSNETPSYVLWSPTDHVHFSARNTANHEILQLTNRPSGDSGGDWLDMQWVEPSTGSKISARYYIALTTPGSPGEVHGR